jgi:DNA invertase Pin-like site-specific DNA recombinase
MEKTRKTKAALYARVSTGKQAEKDLSIPDQIRQLEDYCQSQKWLVHKAYVEPGASARDENRPVFQEMIADALANHRQFDVIVTLTTSRFFRDATKARIYKHKLAKAGVKVVATHQQVADDPMGMFMEGIFELMDQYESDMNGFHTLRAMKENARQGYFNGSNPKFGFMTVAEDGECKSQEKDSCKPG